MAQSKKQATNFDRKDDPPHPIGKVQRTFDFDLDDLIQADEVGNRRLVWNLVTLLLAARSDLPEDFPLAALVEIDLLYAFVDDALTQGSWSGLPDAITEPGLMAPVLKVQAKRIEQALEEVMPPLGLDAHVILRVLDKVDRAMIHEDIASSADFMFNHPMDRSTVSRKMKPLVSRRFVRNVNHSDGWIITHSGREHSRSHPT